jgi:hypothetical protein
MHWQPGPEDNKGLAAFHQQLPNIQPFPGQTKNSIFAIG